MIKVLGNSPERIRINDLQDVIYYRQEKEFTDQELENSKDLQREIRNGKLTVLDKFKSSVSAPSQSQSSHNSSINMHELKQAIRDSLPQGMNSSDMRDAVKEIVPLIVDSVRQELAGLSFSSGGSGSSMEKRSTFVGPEYIPDISTTGMISSIKTEEKQVSGNDMGDALAALKNMNKITNK